MNTRSVGRRQLMTGSLLLAIAFTGLTPVESGAAGRSPHPHLSYDLGLAEQVDPRYGRYLFYSNAPSVRHQAEKFSADGRRLYSSTYTTDQHRRRWNPYNEKNTAETQLLFFGCSVTFGEGLSDEEAIPAQVTHLTRKTRTYNYGTNGYSPAHVLAYLQNFDISKQIPNPKKATFVFLWGDFHFSRLIGSLFHLSWGAATTPYYEFSSGHLQFTGSLAAKFPVRTAISKALAKVSWFWPLMHRRQLDWPLYLGYSEADIELVVQVMKEIHALYRKQFENDRFYVAFLPHSKYSVSKLQGPLAALGIQTIDLTSAFTPLGEAATIAGDGHPSALGAKTLAQELVTHLGLK